MSFICHIHNYTEDNRQWNVFSAFNPSKCTHTWSSGQPMLRHPWNSWGFGALLKGLTSVVDNSCRSRDSNQQPRITCPTLYPLGHDCPLTCLTRNGDRIQSSDCLSTLKPSKCSLKYSASFSKKESWWLWWLPLVCWRRVVKWICGPVMSLLKISSCLSK